MASISNDPGGRRRILFVDKDGNRKAIRLGKVRLHVAEEVWRRVEALNGAVMAGVAIDRDLAHWLSAIGDDLHDKLVVAGLAAPRLKVTVPALGAFCRRGSTNGLAPSQIALRTTSWLWRSSTTISD